MLKQRVALLVCFFLSLPAIAAQKPNVLLIMVDDLNADLGTYGDETVKSPNIDELARQGVRFDFAHNQYPACTPSRSSMLTGLYPENIGVLNNSVNFRKTAPDVVTLPQLFRENGYNTARVGKIFHYDVPGDIGGSGMDDPKAWDEVRNPKGLDVEPKIVREIQSIYPKSVRAHFGGTLSWLSVDSSGSDHTDGKVAQHAADLMEKYDPKKTGQPFFLGVGFFRPHTPFVAPKSFFDLYDRKSLPISMMPKGDRDDIPAAALPDRPYQLDMTDGQRRSAIQAYYASISFVDHQIGLVLKKLDELGLSSNTVVVLMSDHGYQLGDHDLWQKGDLFEGSTKTPLIVRSPYASINGTATSAIVELVDIYPTLAGLAGLELAHELDGQSLAPILEGRAVDHRVSAYSVARSRAGWTRSQYRNKDILGRTIRTSRFRFTQWANGLEGEELYDYEKDPEELTNRSADYRYLNVRAQLKALLDTKAKEAVSSRDRWLNVTTISDPE